MAIFRLSLQALQSTDPEKTAAELDALRTRIAQLPGMVLYPPNATAKQQWGKAFDPTMVQIDLDGDKADAADAAAIDLFRDFFVRIDEETHTE